MSTESGSNAGMVKSFCQSKWDEIQNEYKEAEDKKIIISNYGDFS